jgi:hypothetical protein
MPAATPPAPSAPTIDIESPSALRRWSAELNVPPEALESAVRAVGPALEKVKDFLAAGSAGSQQDG